MGALHRESVGSGNNNSKKWLSNSVNALHKESVVSGNNNSKRWLSNSVNPWGIWYFCHHLYKLFSTFRVSL